MSETIHAAPIIFLKLHPGKHWDPDIKTVLIEVRHITEIIGKCDDDGEWRTTIRLDRDSWVVQAKPEEVIAALGGKTIIKEFQAL